MRFLSCKAAAVLACFLLFVAEVAAQNRSNEIWLFGLNVRLDFSSGTAVPSIFTGFESFEAAATICDPDEGNLILYTNGERLWNGNHEELTGRNKLNGHESSTQGALIMPESCRRYYIFTSDAGEYEGLNIGVHYSLVDMTMGDGRGGFVPGKFNVPLLGQAAEKLTSTHHADRRSYWVLAHGMRDGKFYAWHVTPGGVSQPVVSDVGFPHGSGRPLDGVGAMKISPDGRKLALTMFSNFKVELFDFDNRTGEVYNRKELRQAFETYGVEFSPNSRKLYITTIHELDNFSRLVQYDLDAPDIVGSRFVLYESAEWGHRVTGMQLGPDGKIYVGRLDNEFLNIINEPNRRGKAANLTEMRLPFGSRCHLGMINLYTGAELQLVDDDANELTVSEDATICPGGAVQLLAESEFGGRYQWLPREGLSDPNSQSPTASPRRTTTYIVSVTSTCGSDRDSVTVFVRDAPRPSIEPVATVCAGEEVQLMASGADNYRWEPGTAVSDSTIANPTARPTKTTTYTVYSTNGDGCEGSAQIQVRVFPGPNFDLGPDRTICPGESLRLIAGGGRTYRWWPDEEISATDIARPTVQPSESRTYYVEVTDDVGCSQIDSIHVAVGAGITLPGDGLVEVCTGEEIRLDIEGPEGEYKWTPAAGLDDPNAKNPLARPTRDMTYTVRLISDCGESERELKVRVLDPPEYELNDRQTCEGVALALNPQADPDLEYTWEAGEGIEDPSLANPVVTPTKAQTYYVNISNGACTLRDSVQVSFGAAPPLQVSPGSVICQGDSVQLEVRGAAQYRWTPEDNIDDPTSDSPRVFPQETTWYYVHGSTGTACERIDSILVEVLPAPPLVLSPADPVICPGEVIQVAINDDIDLASVRWTPDVGLNDPDTATPEIRLPRSQTYVIEYETASGCRGRVEYRVTVADPPDVQLDSGTPSLCEGETQEVNATGADEYLWFNAEGELLGSGPSRTVKHDDGRLLVVGRNAAFCADTVELNVLNLGRAELEVQEEHIVCYGDTVTLAASGAARYEWRPVDDLSDPDAAVTQTHTLLNRVYTVTGFTENGCSVSKQVNIRLIPRVDIELSAESPAGGALPGDEIVFRLDFALREELEELLDQREFTVNVNYRKDELWLEPGSVRAVAGLDGWSFNGEVVGGADEFVLSAASDGSPLERRFSLEFRMRVLLVASDSEFINVKLASSNFGVANACGDLDSAQVRLSTFCLREHRGVIAAGMQFNLLQNSPNPAGQTTDIVYSLGFETDVSLRLTDELGRVVRELVDGVQAAGAHRISLNTSELAAGTYRYILSAGPYRESRMLVVE